MKGSGFPHHNDRGSLYGGGAGLFRNGFQRAAQVGGAGRIASGNHGGRGLRGLSRGDQPGGDPLQTAQAHQKHQRALEGGQGLQGFGQEPPPAAVRPVMTWKLLLSSRWSRGFPPRQGMGHGGGDAGHLLKGDPRLLQGPEFPRRPGRRQRGPLPLSRTTVFPSRASRTSRALISSWGME